MKNITRALLVLTLLALAACDFHLRGSNLKDITFAFKTLYVKAPGESAFVVDLRRALKLNKIDVAPSIDKADLVLEVVSEHATKQILSLSASGRVLEYQLFYRVSLRAYDINRDDWLPAEEIAMSRIMSYDNSAILAMEQEEAALFKDMRSDAVGQALRRLNKAKPHQ